jgi:hypothetical protein
MMRTTSNVACLSSSSGGIQEESVLIRVRLTALLTIASCFTAGASLTAGGPCPHLSGVYMIQGEDGQVQISITQHNCEHITIIRGNNYLGSLTSEKHTLVLDGKDHADTPWLGARKRPRTSARFVGSELVVDTATPGDGKLTFLYSLTSERDLNEESVFNRRGDERGAVLVAKRQH